MVKVNCYFLTACQMLKLLWSIISRQLAYPVIVQLNRFYSNRNSPFLHCGLTFTALLLSVLTFLVYLYVIINFSCLVVLSHQISVKVVQLFDKLTHTILLFVILEFVIFVRFNT
nr:hypothetical protein Itr_chr12CG09130 [Ipomoea trifida]